MTEAEALQDTVFTVSELTSIIKEIIEGSFPHIILEGEISNYRPNSSGHVYFTLKDSAAQISAVMFKGKAQSLTFTPKDGMKVQVKGSLSVYAARGNYQIIVSSMHVAGEGDILQMLEERKRKLAAEGLFDESRKKPLPVYPETIGVITSPTGAALHDILNITHRRNNGINVTLLPAIVQGDEAAENITKMIKIANIYKMCDVLIVGRGGGSLEDLLPFSEENVVRAIADSDIPVVSAVGHEIDWALSDYAADKRAPTPSAAAELVTPVKSEVIAYLQRTQDIFYQNITAKLERIKLLTRTFDLDNLELQVRNIEQPLLSRLENAKKTLFDNITVKYTDTKYRIEKSLQTLESYNPENVLSRGYSIVRDKNTKKIIRNGKDTTIGKEIEIIPAKGNISATVTQISN
ncbi:MAG: exodeoxyribonuclease VII large subunit [Treponema sp.]|nr:exodeoxyribonuclease VII large subunit [Treponema sp.]